MNPHLDYPIIAGKTAGRRVTILPDLHPVYQRLEQAARRGNHWARLAVHELNALTTGVIGKNNVYIRPGSQKNAKGETGYIVFLPGLKATIYPTALGSYYVADLVLDGNYFEATEEERDKTRMGLYRADQADLGVWKTKYVREGKVKANAGRLVVISDSGYSSANTAAEKVVPRAMDFPGVRGTIIQQEGCDLHFTPGKKQLGGMVRYNPLSIDSSRASAVHLAATMEQARTVKNVIWATDEGGSAVLTQAMQILVDKGISLKGHTAYLNTPRTSPANALKLAHKLELSLEKAFANTGWDPQGAFSNLSVSHQRLNHKNDRYDKTYHHQALINGLSKASTPMTLTGAAATALGAPWPVVMGIATAAGLISTGGSIYTIGHSLIGNIRDRFKR